MNELVNFINCDVYLFIKKYSENSEIPNELSIQI